MFRLQDWVLLAVTFSSIALGIALPRFGALFQPFPVYCMMSLLFLAFLSIPLVDVWKAVQQSTLKIFFFAFLKLILLPIGVFFLFRMTLPEYALAAMLLSGISTGVVSPFFATLLQANSALVLVLVVMSSILVPFTLPTLVKLLVGRSMEISFFAMTRLLSLVVFLPILLVEILRRNAPSLARMFVRRRYPASLMLFAITNLGIFSKYAEFFHQEPMRVLFAAMVAVLLAGIYFVAGVIFSWMQPVEDQLAVIISFGIMNNVLVIVFGSQFFTPLEPTVAAMYTLPFYSLILPLRFYKEIRVRAKI
jgi:BASS family bile acid:Na+ symporter